jgi:sulfide:quinone oxidoreductase
MGPKALKLMGRMFERRGIKQVVGKPIAGFDEQGVRFKDGERLDADLMLFTSGGAGHPIAVSSDLPTTEAGFVEIDQACRVRGLEDVYAVGDVAAIEGPAWRAKQGHMAEVMARIAVADLARRDADEGEGARESYEDHICILCMMDTGDGAAYVQRDDRRARIIPMPIFGHWLKRGWGWYWKASRSRRFPRLPGM